MLVIFVLDIFMHNTLFRVLIKQVFYLANFFVTFSGRVKRLFFPFYVIYNKGLIQFFIIVVT